MASLTIKGIDADVLKTLKAEASRRRRSLNQEVIARLEASAKSVPIDPDTFLARAREIRKLTKGPLLTERRLGQFKRAGRL